MHHLNPAEMSGWLSNWGYQGVFVCIFIGNLGIPIPEELVLLVAGVLAGRDAFNLGTLYIVAILSAVSGDCCGFLVGRTGGRQAFDWLVRKFPCLRRRYLYLQSFFQKHGNSAVFFARFVTGARFMAGPLAGAAGMPFWSFMGWNFLGACVWCSLIVTVGYFLGNQLDLVVHLFKKGSYWIAAGVLTTGVTIWLIRRHNYQHPRWNA